MVTFRLEQILEKKGKSLYWLAAETGIAYTILYRIKTNQADGIKKQQVDKICEVLKVTPGQLFERV